MAFCQNTCQYTCQSVSKSEGVDMVEGATCVTRSICSRQHRDLISDSKERTASGSQWGMGSQSEFHQSKRKVCLDVLNVCHRFFLPVGLLLKPVEHVQQHVHPASIVCASNQYFVALRTAKKVETGSAGHGMNFVRFAPIGHAFAGLLCSVARI